jgi:hypothetical protein
METQALLFAVCIGLAIALIVCFLILNGLINRVENEKGVSKMLVEELNALKNKYNNLKYNQKQ